MSAETEYRRIWQEWSDERGRLLAGLDEIKEGQQIMSEEGLP